MKKEKKLEVRITEETYNKIKVLAEETESSCSVIIRQAIKEYLQKKETK